MENLELGLLLMVVGMTTVFVILLIVIYMGKGLISLVNKYAPEEIVAKRQAPVVAATPAQVSVATQTSTPTPADLPQAAAIISAISVLTGGQGKVTRIEKK